MSEAAIRPNCLVFRIFQWMWRVLMKSWLGHCGERGSGGAGNLSRTRDNICEGTW
jgi:hypothetical protein